MKLNEWRTKNRYSLPALAKLYREKTGQYISHQTLGNYERGATLPDVKTADNLRKITDDNVMPSSFL